MKKIVKIGMFIFSFFAFLFVSKVEVQAELLESWGYGATNMDDFLDKLREANPGIDQGEEIVVAVFDSIFESDFNHPWLQGRQAGALIYCKGGRCDNKPSEEDIRFFDDGHGIGVAGIIAKATPDNVKILPVWWLGNTSASYKEIIRLKNNGMNIKAVNFSVSAGKRNEDGKCSSDPTGPYGNYTEMDELAEHGILTIVAGGNKNEDLSESCAIVYHSPKSIVVSALDKGMTKADYSSYGTRIDFAAPATNTLSAGVNGTLQLFSGTSSAAPHLTAQIALMYAMCPDCSVETIQEVMQKSAVDIGDIGKDIYYGLGYIDMNIAYAKLTSNGDKVKVTININGPGTLTYSYGYMNWKAWRNKSDALNIEYMQAANTSTCAFNFENNDNCMFYYFEKDNVYTKKAGWFKNHTSINLELDYGTDVALFLVSSGSRIPFLKSEFQNVRVDGNQILPINLPDKYLIYDIRENTIIDINYKLRFCIFGICF